MSVPAKQGSPKKSIPLLCVITDGSQSSHTNQTPYGAKQTEPVMVKCSCHQIANAIKKAKKRQQKAQK